MSEQLQELQNKIQTLQANEIQLVTHLNEKDYRLQQTELELRTQKKRHLDEMRNASQTISSLRAEVEAKSNNIAYLTTELHRLKMKQKMESVGGNISGTSGSNTIVAADSGLGIVRRTQPQYAHLPAPPRDVLTNSGRMRNRAAHSTANPNARQGVAVPNTSTSSSNSNSTEEDVLVRTLRVASASTRSSGSLSPDIKPFVHRNMDASIPKVEVKKPMVLPPIASATVDHSEHTQLDVHKVMIAQQGRNGVARNRQKQAPPEVTTLAVDQVGEATWNRVHESRSSEYN